MGEIEKSFVVERTPHFEIKNAGAISKAFLERNIHDFINAANFIKNLEYGRNKNKEDLLSVFAEHKGTCSTKHAVLKQLANENSFEAIDLMVGIFKMNADNTPKVFRTLAAHGLSYIPEAHVYLKCRGNILDFTRPDSDPKNFVDDLLFEKCIQPNEIGAGKITLHKNFISDWLGENKNISERFSVDAIWQIREQCIKDLSTV